MNITKKTIILLLLSLLCLALVVAAYIILTQRYSVKNQPDQNRERQAENLLFNAQKAMEAKMSERPMPEEDLTDKETYDRGAIKIVKNSEFRDVVDKPKSQMEILNEMAERKDKTMISLEEKDLDKKINLYAGMKTSEKIQVSRVPEPGDDLADSKKTMITAPVEFKLFKTEPVWREFAKTHKIRPFTPDFSRSYALILVSTSELPNGIFKTESVEASKDQVTVLYRVDPLEMAAGNEEGTQHHYSAINVPKTENIKLRQIQ